MRAGPTLLLFLLLAGCTAPQEPLLSDSGAARPQNSAPSQATPPAEAPPSSANATAPPANETVAEPGSDAWTGTLHLLVLQTGVHGGWHDLAFEGAVQLNVTVTLTGGVSQGGLRLQLQPEPSDGCGSPETGDIEGVLEAEGPSPLTLQGIVEAGAYCFWVRDAPDSVHVAAEYQAEAVWVPAPAPVG